MKDITPEQLKSLAIALGHEDAGLREYYTGGEFSIAKNPDQDYMGNMFTITAAVLWRLCFVLRISVNDYPYRGTPVFQVKHDATGKARYCNTEQEIADAIVEIALIIIEEKLK